jgi:ABC-2 type transport system ATP-binding protein
MKMELIGALLHWPKVIFLDEPTIGLDVLSKQRLREFLMTERADHGTTLLLTTHDMGDIERLCERVLVVDHGHLVHDGTLGELSAASGAERVLVVDANGPTPDLDGIAGTRLVGSEADGMRQRLALTSGEAGVPAVLAAVFGRADVRDVSIEEPDIEDVVRRIYLARGR